MQKVTIYTDGACRGNPGKGGYGCVLLFTDKNSETHRKEFSQGYSNTTNNRMELLAVITGVEALKFPCELKIYSDSKYVVDAFNKNWIDGWIKRNWKKVKNIDLWKRLLADLEKHSYKFIWVEGHAGNKENETCDTLATTAADSENLIEDTNYTNLQSEQMF